MLREIESAGKIVSDFLCFAWPAEPERSAFPDEFSASASADGRRADVRVIAATHLDFRAVDARKAIPRTAAFAFEKRFEAIITQKGLADEASFPAQCRLITISPLRQRRRGPLRAKSKVWT